MLNNAFCFRKPIIENCVAFENNCCFAENCGFLHKYKYCYKYQNTTCHNNKCPFLHCTSLEQLRYETTGKESEHLKREVGRTLQSSSICGDYKNGDCTQTKCRLRHVKFNACLQCPIRRENITVESLGAGECGHMFCLIWALRCSNDTNKQFIEITCPICRRTIPYIKLS